MGRFVGWRALLGCIVASGFMVFGVSGALADDFHGIAFAKGCTSPVEIGDPYTCSLQILNVVDTAQDTLRVTGFSDVVHSAGGDVATGNILSTTGLVFNGAVSCTGGSGAGTSGDPYLGATECLLPFGTSIQTKPFSHYTVQANDFNLPNHQLADTATLNWNNTCTAPSPNCTTDTQENTAGASAVVQKLPSATATDIHNAAHAVVTAVAVGTTVHDFVTVTGQQGAPVPSGNVSIDWFLNGDCSGQPAANSGSVGPLDASGHFDATAFAFPVNTAGFRAFTAHYLGDNTYLSSDGACEPLQVVDANVQISPATATNRVDTNHVLTCHVNVNDGNGFANAPAGTVCTGSIVSGPGSFVGSNQCATVGTSGDCQLTITSAVTGLTTIHASTDVLVAGVSLHRETGDGHAGDGANAQKLWVNAAILIAPNATNEVGQPHTFTATLLFDTGSGLQPAGANQPVTVTLASSNGATPVPAGPFTLTTNAAGQVSVTFTSQAAGQVAGHASWTGSVSGSAPFTVQTDGQAPNSANAVKTFVDAYITISPPEAVNPVNTTHTYTAHVFINDGSGAAYTDAPDGTVVSFAFVGGHVGSFSAGNQCTISNGAGTCTVDTSSADPGDDTMQASSTLAVGGVSLTRTTGQVAPGHANGGNAAKNWVGAKIAIEPDATNEIGASHTFTVTVSKDTGGGFQPAVGEHVDFSLTDSNGASHSAPTGTCAAADTNAAGECTITFTSATAGMVTAHAVSTLAVDGHSITVETDGTADNSDDAVKTFVDANIQIAPLTDNNPVSTNHTLTAHVNVNKGAGAGFESAPAGTLISFSLVNSGGASASFVGPSSCTVASGGSCSVVISSSTTGTTTTKATTTVSVGGVSLTRATADAKLADSADASKTWADATARTDILNAQGTVILSAVAGTVVRDKVFVARAAGTPAGVPDPTGTVVFHRFATINCLGASVDQSVALSVGNPSTAVSDAFAVTADMSYQAEYKGDVNYPARTGACEPLTVTPVPAPAIAIVKNPKSQSLAVGGTATFTITVTNTGNVVLTDVHVVDPLSPNCNRTKAEIPALASMAPGAQVTYTCTRPNVRSAFDNVATAIGTPPTGPDVTASDTAPVTTKAPLTPKKVVKKKKKPKVVSHKKPKATG